jgi:hypothetical protein
MSREQLLKEAMALPIEQRVDIAQALWASIDEGSENEVDDEARTIATARLRNTELSDGTIREQSHEEVMTAARRALRCE